MTTIAAILTSDFADAAAAQGYCGAAAACASRNASIS